MGEILTEIREELRNTPSHAPTQPNTSTDTQHSVLTTNHSAGDVNTENVTSDGNLNTGETNHPDMEH